jgi:hypothetical protein
MGIFVPAVDGTPRTPERRSVKVKVRHWIILILVAIGGLYLWHNYSQHGGVAGMKSGLGLGGA